MTAMKAADDRLVKKMRLTKGVRFKHKGNEKQHIFNEEIRIADRSEYGWNMVAEYEEDKLANGSDDEKRLYKAELQAGR